MKLLIQNIRLCISVVFMLLGIFLFTCNKPVVIKKEIRGQSGQAVTHDDFLKDPIATVDTNRVTLYLSFDDGPTRGSRTVNAISVDDSININVFVIGRFVFRNDSSFQLFQLYQNNSLVEIGNHSYTHADSHYRLFYQNPDEVRNEFLMNYDTLHLSHKIARLPGRNCWKINGRSRSDLEDAKASADSLAADGYAIFGWDIEWRYDSTGRAIESAAEMIEKIEGMVEKRNSFTPFNIVLLCHDPMLSNSYNKSEMRIFIRKIKMRSNYRFEHLSNYPR